MAIANINRFIRLFREAFEGLGVKVPAHDVEVLAMLVHDSMEHGRRIYHTSHHVFGMGEGMNPRQLLATLFHDVVYFQLDDGFPRRASGLLKRATRVRAKTVMLKPIDPGDKSLLACATIFGFAPGQKLPLYGGLNEVLSSVVAVRALEPWLPLRDLIAIVACIEATVPFRGPDAQGRESPQGLADRVREAARVVGEPMSDKEVDDIVRDAVATGNSDVASFATQDPGLFLSTTWQLIEESNAPLAEVGVYSVRDYRCALTRMETFLSTLNPANVFHRYDGEPDDAEFEALRARAERNIHFSADYLGAKIAAIALIEALSVVTGGDCPVSMLLGDIEALDGSPARIEHFLPPARKSEPVDASLLAVLETGRTKEAKNDLTVSPLTAYLYRSLGHEGTKRARERATHFFNRRLSARDFLSSLDPTMVGAIAKACSEIAVSRRNLFLHVESSCRERGQEPRINGS